jgi:hypothetical protein
MFLEAADHEPDQETGTSQAHQFSPQAAQCRDGNASQYQVVKKQFYFFHKFKKY